MSWLVVSASALFLASGAAPAHFTASHNSPLLTDIPRSSTEKAIGVSCLERGARDDFNLMAILMWRYLSRIALWGL
jgi:hypothetical protein